MKRIMARATCLAAVGLLASGLAHAQSVGVKVAPDTTERILAEIRALYDSGFARIIALLPTNAENQASPLWPLSAIARFRQQSVGWAMLDGETYRTLAPGPLPRAWLVVVPPGSPAFGRMKGALQLDPFTELIVAQIAPARVTEPWAGVFLARQLSLLADYSLGATPRSPNAAQYQLSQFRASLIELSAADLLASGALRDEVDDLLGRWAATDAAAVVERIAFIDGKVLASLTRVVPADAPRSSTEAELRRGFILAAILIRYCEITATSAEACGSLFAQLDERLRASSSKRGAGAQTSSRWCQYEVRTPDTIIARQEQSVMASDLVVSSQQFPSRLIFRFTGQVRRLSPERSAFLQKYFRFLRRPGADTTFAHDIQLTCRETATYWFPIQEAMLEDFRAEVAPGDSTTLFLLLAGAYGPKNGPKDWVFLINEFTSARSAAYWAGELGTCAS